MKNSIKETIRSHALDLGFDVCRFTTPPADFSNDLNTWLEKNYHGTMDWMAKNADVRANPQVMWDGVKSIIVVGMNYGPADDPLQEVYPPPEKMNVVDPGLRRDDEMPLASRTGYISVYARGDDYHDVLKKKLKQLGNYLAQEHGAMLKVFVDTAPVMEKPLAEKAGIGWQGKHTVLLSREFGNWLFLGVVYCDLELEADEKEKGSCGSCTRCQDICPTNAFPQSYQLDARRCISYLTIEHKGPIPEEFRKAIGNRIYGCDDCVAICPWNKFSRIATENKFHARTGLNNPPLKELAKLDDAAFREMFRKSPIKRIGRNRFVRNVLIAIGNSGDDSLKNVVIPLLNDPDPVVADAAAWAQKELKKALL